MDLCYQHDEKDYKSIYYIEIVAYTHSIGFFMFDMWRHYYYKTLDLFYFWHHAVVIIMETKYNIKTTIFNNLNTDKYLHVIQW